MLHGDSKTKFYLWTEVSLHCMSVPSTDSPGWASLDFLLRWYKLFSDRPPPMPLLTQTLLSLGSIHFINLLAILSSLGF